MAEFSLPWENGLGDGQIYNSSQWRESWRRLLIPYPDTDGVLFSGVAASELLTVTGGASVFTVGAGAALVYGGLYTNSSPVTLIAPSPVAGRRDRIVLRKTWASGTIRLVYKTGTVGAPPALTQVAGNTWEIPIAQVTLPSTITDERSYANLQRRERFYPYEYSTYGLRGLYGWSTLNTATTQVNVSMSRPVEEIARTPTTYLQLLNFIPYQVSLIYAGTAAITGTQSVVLNNLISSFSTGGMPTTTSIGPSVVNIVGVVAQPFSGQFVLPASSFPFVTDGVYTVQTERDGAAASDTFSGDFQLLGARVRYHTVR